MMGLAVRDRQPELMDQPGLDPALHAQALRGLARVNAISRTVPRLWKQLTRTARSLPDETLHVLDVACGGGDNVIGLARQAGVRQIPMKFSGCDISESAIEIASARAERAGVDVTFFQHDALRDRIPDGVDAVYCSLFLHHLDHSEAVRLLQRFQESTARLALIDDLIRSRWGYVMAWCGVRLLTRSRICHVDGPLSVRAAWTPSEALELARQAGIPDARIRTHWPQRFLLSWSRS